MAIELFQEMAAYMATINKRLSRASRKLITCQASHHHHRSGGAYFSSPKKTAPKLGRRVSLIPFLSKKKKARKESGDYEGEMEIEDNEGVWRRTILMGEKCEPLEFSGVIYYDNNGKQLPEIPPKSPRHPSFSGLPTTV